MAKKRIKILTRGPIRVKGFINGPVLTPYFEDISTIFAMISQGIHVVEVCDDRSEVRLTTSNIYDDNSKASREEKAALLEPKTEEPKKVEEVKPEAVTITEPVIETKEEVIEQVEAVIEEKVEEVKPEEQTAPQKTYEKPQYNNNYNKHNKHNNNYKNNNYKKENQIKVETPVTEPIKVGE